MHHEINITEDKRSSVTVFRNAKFSLTFFTARARGTDIKF